VKKKGSGGKKTRRRAGLDGAHAVRGREGRRLHFCPVKGKRGKQSRKLRVRLHVNQ